MKFRLKDRALQKKLDEISGGDFTKRLQESVSKIAPVVVFCFGESPYPESKHRYMVSFRHDEIEEVIPYDPSTWNEWPNVNPPAHVLMRVEILTQRFDQDGPEPRGGRPRFRGCAKFDGQYWDFKDMAHLSAGETVRFRPWEDKE